MNNNLKIAFSGSSGSGKTTLVKFVHEQFGLPWISGSAGDLKNTLDAEILQIVWGREKRLPDGHREVIAGSVLNPQYGVINQLLLQSRRTEVLKSNQSFVTDRSPVDNFTYFINQCGHLPNVDDALCKKLFEEAAFALTELDLLVYVKAAQPITTGIENNGSRVDNWWWQKSVDAQFDYWFTLMTQTLEEHAGKIHPVNLPTIMVINYWDLEKRKLEISKVIKEIKNKKKLS